MTILDGPEYPAAHGYDCDCAECAAEHAIDMCGQLPEDLGGGCLAAGSEYCDWKCPFRQQVFREATP